MDKIFDPNKWYSIDEIANELRVTRTTVRSQLEDKNNANGVPYAKVGMQYRINGGIANNSFGSQTYNGNVDNKITGNGEMQVKTANEGQINVNPK